MLSMLLVALLAAAGTAWADCRDLAKRFGQSPEALSDTELAQLQSCVRDTLKQRLGATPSTATGPAVRPAPAPKAHAPPRPAPPLMPAPER
jgi:hypothetical protein